MSPIINCRADKRNEINKTAPPANESEVENSVNINDNTIAGIAINREIIRKRKFLFC